MSAKETLVHHFLGEAFVAQLAHGGRPEVPVAVCGVHAWSGGTFKSVGINALDEVTCPECLSRIKAGTHAHVGECRTCRGPAGAFGALCFPCHFRAQEAAKPQPKPQPKRRKGPSRG